jgi:hypothetical protein
MSAGLPGAGPGFFAAAGQHAGERARKACTKMHRVVDSRTARVQTRLRARRGDLPALPGYVLEGIETGL